MTKKADVGYDTETPQVFTKEQRRHDPLLVAEETNFVFEAFLRRRKFHKHHLSDYMGSFVKGKHDDRAADQFKVILWAAGITAITFGLAYPITIFSIITMNIRARIASTKLPFRCLQVFSFRGYSESVAMDLVQAGIGGGDILEAIYLEARRIHFTVAKVGYIILFVALTCVYTWIFYPLKVVPFLFLLTIPITVWRLFAILTDAKIVTDGRIIMMSRLIQWSADSPFEGVRKFARLIAPSIFRRVVTWLGTYLVLLFTILYFREVLSRVARRLAMTTDVTTLFLAIAALACAGIVAWSYLGRQKRVARYTAKVQYYISLGDDAFNNFVLTRLLEDPDAKKLAAESMLGKKVLQQLSKTEGRWFWNRT